MRHARSVMYVGIANSWWRGKRFRHSGACATRNFTYLVRCPWCMQKFVKLTWMTRIHLWTLPTILHPQTPYNTPLVISSASFHNFTFFPKKSRTKIGVFGITFYRNLFPRVPLTISQHRFRLSLAPNTWQHNILTNEAIVSGRLYATFRLDKMLHWWKFFNWIEQKIWSCHQIYSTSFMR